MKIIASLSSTTSHLRKYISHFHPSILSKVFWPEIDSAWPWIWIWKKKPTHYSWVLKGFSGFSVQNTSIEHSSFASQFVWQESFTFFLLKENVHSPCAIRTAGILILILLLVISTILRGLEIYIFFLFFWCLLLRKLSFNNRVISTPVDAFFSIWKFSKNSKKKTRIL